MFVRPGPELTDASAMLAETLERRQALRTAPHPVVPYAEQSSTRTEMGPRRAPPSVPSAPPALVNKCENGRGCGGAVA